MSTRRRLSRVWCVVRASLPRLPCDALEFDVSVHLIGHPPSGKNRLHGLCGRSFTTYRRACSGIRVTVSQMGQYEPFLDHEVIMMDCPLQRRSQSGGPEVDPPAAPTNSKGQPNFAEFEADFRETVRSQPPVGRLSFVVVSQAGTRQPRMSHVI